CACGVGLSPVAGLYSLGVWGAGCAFVCVCVGGLLVVVVVVGVGGVVVVFVVGVVCVCEFMLSGVNVCIVFVVFCYVGGFS
ncbi:hypothetical protein AAHH80_36235, partial [Burkholderia pseudomallei]